MNEMQRSLSSLARENEAGTGYNSRVMSNRMTPLKPSYAGNSVVVEKEEYTKTSVVKQSKPHAHYGNLMHWVFWFVVIVVIVWFLLWALKPDMLKKRDEEGNFTGEIDTGRLLMSAVVLALIILVIMWIFKWSCGSC